MQRRGSASKKWLRWAVLIERGGGSQGIRKRWSCVHCADFGRAELYLRTAIPQTSVDAVRLRILLRTSISPSTMCTLPSDPFVEPFYNLKKAFTRLLSPMPKSVDDNTINIARPSSAPLILRTPALTIHAADMPATSKILFDLSATQ